MFSNKLAKAISALLISMAGVSAAQATTITFDNNTSTIVNFGTDGSYSEAGFSINATSSTGLSIVDSNYFGTNSGLNGTNFGYINNGGIFNLTQTNSTPFSLQSFYAGAIFGNGFPSPTLTLTGTLFGGGSITQTLNLIGNAQGAAAGSSFNLTGWNNLTSVQFQSTGSNSH
jgi:hypothetical protein